MNTRSLKNLRATGQRRRVQTRSRELTPKELREWRERLNRIAAGHRQHYWGTL